MEFDLRNSSVTSICLQLRGKEYQISLIDETLSGSFVRPDTSEEQAYTVSCKGISQRLSLRILGDRDCIEIFINEGRYNYTEEYGFDPENTRLLVFSDARLPCTIQYAEMDSCW